NRALVGAFNKRIDNKRTGAAYIFHWDGRAWREEARIRPSRILDLNHAGYGFGRTVSLSGDRAIISAVGDDAGGLEAGAAYIFERDEHGQWVETAFLQASDIEAWDGFGWSVAISGHRAVVGAREEDSVDWNAGAAYVFERDSHGIWNEVAKLRASDQQVHDQFGAAVAIDGDDIIVGVEQGDLVGRTDGAAYIFTRATDGSWLEAAVLHSVDPEDHARFGGAVSIRDGRAAVAAWSEDLGGRDAGAVYIYVRRLTGGWDVERKITARAPQSDARFGYAVDLSRDALIAGSFTALPEQPSLGRARIFECGFPAPIFSETVIPGDCPGDYTLERTWTATDPCGHSTSATQMVRVVDSFDRCCGLLELI
ncbi:MAG: FG-GAP repeat protein, partial [Verrucomicrobiota bacterium]